MKVRVILVSYLVRTAERQFIISHLCFNWGQTTTTSCPFSLHIFYSFAGVSSPLLFPLVFPVPWSLLPFPVRFSVEIWMILMLRSFSSLTMCSDHAKETYQGCVVNHTFSYSRNFFLPYFNVISSYLFSFLLLSLCFFLSLPLHSPLSSFLPIRPQQVCFCLSTP